VEKGEVPEVAARRTLEQETGLRVDVSLWKHYNRQHPLFTVDQYVFTGNAGDTRNLLILGNDAQFLRPSEVRHLNIGYGFDSLLEEYFLLHER
jgi:8-oxo-dGTP pyrophosphatase MutT (NUDIX family)